MAEILRRLLHMLDGVGVERLRTHPSGSATAVLRISHPVSVARLACWATNTNLSLSVRGESWGATDEEWSAPERVSYVLTSGTAPAEGPDQRLSVELFCNQMINDLADRGRLDRTEADRLLDELGFVEGTSET